MTKITKLFFLLSLLMALFISGNVVYAQSLQEDLQPSIETELTKDLVLPNIEENKEVQQIVKPRAKVKKPPPEVELITFSARNISVKDAFATLARISGKSISVGSDIGDNETIAVVEIKELGFEEAFFTLIDASMVNYSQTGNSYTVMKSGSALQLMIFGFGTTAVDKDLPLLERRADLSYDNQDLATLLKDLANKYGIDIVLTATPTERVSARVREVNIREALDLVLSGTSFDYAETGENSETYLIYNRLNKNFTVGQTSKLFTLMNLEAMDVQNLLPVQIRANVRISNDQNAIIADGSINDLKRLEEFLHEIDKPLPQVELELKLIEVSRSANIEFKPLQSTFSVGDFTKIVEDPIAKLVREAANIAGKKAEAAGGEAFSPTLPAAADLMIVNGGLSTFSLNSDNIKLFNNQITYLESRGLAEVRSYPKLVSLSGRTAMINIDVDTNLVLGSATGQAGSIAVQTQQLQRITAGTALSITPVVGSGGLISAKVQIEVSDNSGTTDQNGVSIPKTTTRRRISNEIQVRDGETVAIGGLLVDNSSKTRGGFPVINRIPVIGDWFSNRTNGINKSELIVLITPKIRNIPEDTSTASIFEKMNTGNQL